jgi:hypothetical protein
MPLEHPRAELEQALRLDVRIGGRQIQMDSVLHDTLLRDTLEEQ